MAFDYESCEQSACTSWSLLILTLEWRHNGRDGVSNNQPHDCLLNRLLRRRSKKTSKLRVTGLCAGISPVTGEYPAHMASNAEYVSIWWRHHELPRTHLLYYTRLWISLPITAWFRLFIRLINQGVIKWLPYSGALALWKLVLKLKK